MLAPYLRYLPKLRPAPFRPFRLTTDALHKDSSKYPIAMERATRLFRAAAWEISALRETFLYGLRRPRQGERASE